MKKLLSLLLLNPLFLTFSQEEKTKTTEIEINTLIKGTLFSAEKTKKKATLVILIAGSGATDRNGNTKGTGENNSLKYLAEGLTNEKTSVFSYDKRIFQQMKDKNLDEKSLRFDDMITDAGAVFSYFKSQNKYGKIYFAGHSEGSLIGMIAAREQKADGFISLAGAGRPVDEVLLEQIEKQATIILDDSKKVMDSLRKGTTVEIKNPMLNVLFRESVQPYMISWIKLKPQEEIKKLNIPILIINGTKDMQVPATEAYLLNKANPKSELYIIENMNHVFKEIINDDDNLKSYSNPNLPVVPSLIERIKVFLNKK
jgi:uncharacterized protein